MVKMAPVALAKELSNEKLDNFAMDRMKNYGQEVIEDRALPDFRDGILPVHRRIIWGMHQEKIHSTGGTKKAARIVGDVMGKYHPHGDQTIYGAMVTLVNQPQPVVIGQGNWGFFGNRAAPMRYTEIKLSAYAEKVLLARDYMNVIKTRPNYDGEEREPIYLPALLPHLLINGISGIAVGVSVYIPPFASKGIITLLRQILTGKKITAKDCLKHLRINYPAPYNSVVLTPEVDLLEFYATGKGRLNLGVEFTTQGHEMIINKFPPYFTMDNAKIKLQDKIAEIARVDDISDGRNKILRVMLKSTVPIFDRAAIFQRCADLLEVGLNMRINFIERIDADKVKFGSCNMPDWLMQWTAWRIKLEKIAHKYILKQQRLVLRRQQLMLLACNNLDKIFEELKRRTVNLDQRLAKALTISIEQAQTIARMQVQSLSALSKNQVVADIAKSRQQMKQTKIYIRQPTKKILQDLPKLLESIN